MHIILNNVLKLFLILQHIPTVENVFCHTHKQGPDFDVMSSFFPCEIDDAIQYINLGYGSQAPKIVIL